MAKKDRRDLRKFSNAEVADDTILTTYRNGVLKTRGNIPLNRAMQKFGYQRRAAGSKGTSIPSQFVNRYMTDGGVSNKFYGANPRLIIEDVISEVDRVIAQFPNPLEPFEEVAAREFIEGQLLLGNWQKLDVFYSFGLTDIQNSLMNWIDGSFATPVASPTHGVGEGYTFNGTTQYIDTGWNPATDADNYKEQDANILIYYPTINSNDGNFLYGVRDGSGGNIEMIGTGGTAVNSGQGSAVEPPLSNTMIAATRDDNGSNLPIFHNGQPVGTSNFATFIGLPDNPMYIGALNNSGTPTAFKAMTVSSFVAGAAIEFNQPGFYDGYIQYTEGAEIDILIASFPDPLTDLEDASIRTMFSSLYSTGNWFKIDSFATFNLSTEDNSLWDWKRKVALTNTLAVHKPSIGFDFNGSTAFIDIEYAPSTDGVSLKLDDALIGAFCVSNGTASRSLMGITSSLMIEDNVSSTRNRGEVNDANNATFGTFNDGISPGALYTLAREGSTEITMRKNATEIVQTSASTSSAVSNINIFVGARNTAGNPVSLWLGDISSYIVGAAIGFDHPGFNNALVAYNNSFLVPAIISSYPGTLTATEEALLTTFWDAEATNGNAFKLDRYVCMALSDPLNAVWSPIQQTAMTPVNAPVHDPNFGFIYDGATNYHDSGYNPFTDGKNYKQNDALMGAFLSAIQLTDAMALFGANDAIRNTYIIDLFNGTVRMPLNSGVTAFNHTLLNNSLYVLSRDNSADNDLFKDGILLNTITEVSTGIADFNILIGVRPNVGAPTNFLDGTISSFLAGAAIGFSQSDFYNHQKALLDGLRVEGIIDSFPNALTTEEEAAIRVYLTAELANGNWDKLDSFVFLGLMDATNSEWDAVRKTAVTSNTGTHVSGIGMSYSASTSTDSGYNPVIAGVNFKLDDVIAGVYVVENSNTGDAFVFGSSDADGTYLRDEPASSRARVAVNSGSLVFGDDIKNSSLELVTRVAGSIMNRVINGVEGAGVGRLTTGIGNESFRIGARAGNETWPGTIATFQAGAGVGYNHTEGFDNLKVFLGALEAEGVIASFPNALAAGEADLIRAFVIDSYAAGNWQLMDNFVDMALTDATNALWDWKRKATLTNILAVHDPGVGYVFNGTTSTIGLGSILGNPSNYSLEDALTGVYLQAINFQANSSLWTIRNTNSSINRGLAQLDGTADFSINGAPSAEAAIAADQVLVSIRKSATEIEVYNNGALGGSNNAATLGTIPAGSGFIGSQNDSINYLDGTIGAFVIGAAIGFSQSQFNTHLRTLLGV